MVDFDGFNATILFNAQLRLAMTERLFGKLPNERSGVKRSSHQVDEPLECHRHGLPPHPLAPAPEEEPARLRGTILLGPREPDEAHGLARHGAARTGDAGDGDTERGTAARERTLGHLARGLLAHGAMREQR